MNQKLLIITEPPRNSISQHKQYMQLKLVNNFTVDFNKLALLDPSLQENVIILNNRVVWNFSTQQSLIKLTRALMKYIFHFEWHCPIANLCPRIPSRVNYLLWLSIHMEEEVTNVVDVGTGATLIYPLIGWALFRWKFIGLEINQKSYESSKKIVEINKLEDCIEVRHSQHEEESILYPNIRQQQNISLVVCNPPFFQDDQPTLSAMQGQEHHFDSGEYGFFFLLYKDSFRYTKINCFSCLIGRATDYHEVKQFLINEEAEGFISFLKFGEILQGKNKRFIVLWKIRHP